MFIDIFADRHKL